MPGPIRCLPLATAMLLCGACKPVSSPSPQLPAEKPSDELLVYCSVDETFGRAVLKRFRDRTGIALSVVFDSEAGKTSGLVNKIIQEAASGRPRADALWSSELFNTIILARKGLLEPYESPAAADIPARFKDPGHRWTAMAARPRVIAFDPARIDASAVPQSWFELASPAFAGKTAFANPMFGTTRGHVAAMFALWGPKRARTFLQGLQNYGALIADGNSAAVRAVMAGRAVLAATDSDDVWVAQRAGASLQLVYPDMGDGGTLLIPCSVAIIAGHDRNVAGPAGHRRQSAQRLVDYLVSVEVERMLAQSDSRNIPVRDALLAELDMRRPPETKLTFDAIADRMDESLAAVREILIR